ncbi:MAG: hypothetical protein QM734_06405 [Cyclobacteriaceae bacterium]
MRRVKLNFVLVSLLLLMTRCSDFYSTGLWFHKPDGYKDETNPLTSYLGMSWNGLIIVNTIICLIALTAFYYYSFHYRPKSLTAKPKNIFEYISICYFNEPGKYFQSLYRIPKDLKTTAGHVGYILIRVMIFGGIIATAHNLCQYYKVGFYDSFRTIVGRPLFVIYGLFFLSFFYFQFQLARKEFRQLK